MKAGDPTVFVVDDDSSMREALSDLISSVGLLVEAFKSAREFLAYDRPNAPGCLVLDVRLPGLSGLDLQRELIRSEAPVPIIFITGHGDIPMSVRAIKEGAVDFLTKPFRDQDLLDAVQRALENDRAARQERAKVTELRRRYESLTKREGEVMKLIVSGLLNKQIAGELGTSEVTIKIHRGHVMLKMKAQSVVLSAEQFLSSRQLRQTDCLILDVRMPGIGGLELGRRLAAGGHRIPIVFMTAHGGDDASNQAFQAGAVEFLIKPFSQKSLVRAVHSALADDQKE
jgi:FixJ family two-component response regulator